MTVLLPERSVDTKLIAGWPAIIWGAVVAGVFAIVIAVTFVAALSPNRSGAGPDVRAVRSPQEAGLRIEDILTEVEAHAAAVAVYHEEVALAADSLRGAITDLRSEKIRGRSLMISHGQASPLIDPVCPPGRPFMADELGASGPLTATRDDDS
ncbi:MAG: hypothetical protein ABWX92_11100 [Mycetocola sp.]